MNKGIAGDRTTKKGRLDLPFRESAAQVKRQMYHTGMMTFVWRYMAV